MVWSVITTRCNNIKQEPAPRAKRMPVKKTKDDEKKEEEEEVEAVDTNAKHEANMDAVAVDLSATLSKVLRLHASLMEVLDDISGYSLLRYITFVKSY